MGAPVNGQPPRKLTLSQEDRIELEAINRQYGNFKLLSLGQLIVSFSHVMTTMWLYSDGSTWSRVVIGIQTAILDWTIWTCSGYFSFAKQRGYPRNGWIVTIFCFAIGILVVLNGVSIWSNRPDDVPVIASAGLSVFFALFVPLTVAAAPIVENIMDVYKRDYMRDAEARIAEQERQSLTTSSPLTGHNKAKKIQPALGQTIPLPSLPQNVLPAPDENAVLRSGNGKAEISPTDVDAILSRLHDAGVTSFQFAKDLMPLCGWAANSSATKARDALLEAGYIQRTETGFIVAKQLISQSASQSSSQI